MYKQSTLKFSLFYSSFLNFGRKKISRLALSVVLIEWLGFMALCIADFQHNCCNWFNVTKQTIPFLLPRQKDDCINDIFPHLQGIKTRVPVGTMTPISHNWNRINKKKVWERGMKQHGGLSEVLENNFNELLSEIHFNILYYNYKPENKHYSS